MRAQGQGACAVLATPTKGARSDANLVDPRPCDSTTRAPALRSVENADAHPLRSQGRARAASFSEHGGAMRSPATGVRFPSPAAAERVWRALALGAHLTINPTERLLGEAPILAVRRQGI